MGFGRDLNLEATELSLGLPGTTSTTSQDHETSPKSTKRSLPDMNEESTESRDDNCSNVLNHDKKGHQETPPPSKTQVVGWPPIRSYRKNCLQAKKTEDEAAEMFVKVSLDGAPFLRKIDLKVYRAYPDLLRALEEMFKFRVGEYSEREGYNGSDYALTYQDKDGDWMLVGDIPWHMFLNSCKRLRIVKGSEAGSLGCAL